MMKARRFNSNSFSLILHAWVWLLMVGLVCGGARMAWAQGEGRGRVARAAAPAGEVTIILSEQFFNAFLDEVFTDLKAPSYKISVENVSQKKEARARAAHVSAVAAQNECESVVVLEREIEGVRTSVRFENGRIVAPLAFKGSYASTLLGCLKFQGWADTFMTLEFDAARQVLNARINVVDIHLNKVPKAAGGALVGMVQKAIALRLNPVETLQAAQLSAHVPVAASGGALRLRAREVRPEITRGALQLHIVYEFTRAE
jgi:hypothetical protein